MKQIDEYVDSICLNLKGNKKEIQELKAEMKSHLLESVQELKTDGKAESEAVEIAIDRFGKEQELDSIGQLPQLTSGYVNWIIFLAISLLTLSFLIFVILGLKEGQSVREPSAIRTQIKSMLEFSESITPAIEEEVENLVQQSNSISNFQIYHLSGKEFDDVFAYVDYVEPDYEFNRNEWLSKKLFPKIYPSGGGNEEWYIKTERVSYHTLSYIILFLGIVIYWALFSIWALINVYHRRKLNLMSFFVIIFFNFMGYLLLSLFERRNVNSPKIYLN